MGQGVILDYSVGPKTITGVSIEGGRRARVRKGQRGTRAERGWKALCCGFEDGGFKGLPMAPKVSRVEKAGASRG